MTDGLTGIITRERGGGALGAAKGLAKGLAKGTIGLATKLPSGMYPLFAFWFR